MSRKGVMCVAFHGHAAWVFTPSDLSEAPTCEINLYDKITSQILIFIKYQTKHLEKSLQKYLCVLWLASDPI